MKGPYGGVLISAVALDANSGLFPLAIMVAEGENKDSWNFFLYLLYSHIGENRSRPISFMTDRQKGVLDGIMKEFHNSFNRYCVRHMYNNFKGKFPRIKLRNCFWEAARATYSNDFKKAMHEMSLINKEAVQWVEKTPPAHWSRHRFDDSCKSEHVNNNLTESFNSWLESTIRRLFLCYLRT